MSARASYWAARWSMEVLLGRRLIGEASLFNPLPVPADSCFLWTLTTPDVCEPAAVLKRWRGAVRNWTGLRCFRVIERHPKGHGWHVHFITVERLNVRAVRKMTTRHGFGRINVKEIPSDKAFYVVKYLVKALRQTTGRRLWACVGFQGVRANDMVVEDSFWKEVYSYPAPSGYSLGARRQLGLQRIREKMFHRDPSEPSNAEVMAVGFGRACWIGEQKR